MTPTFPRRGLAWNGVGRPIDQHLAKLTPTNAEVCQVNQPTIKQIKSIPPAKAVRESLHKALNQVQLLRDLLRLAERKERQGDGPRQQKGSSNG
jgi:hypothetical protein